MSGYETVTAADLRVGDVFKGALGVECEVTRMAIHPGNSTVWIQHTIKGGTLSGTFGLTHPFERLIVPATESVAMRAGSLRVGDVIAGGPWHDKVVEAVTPLRVQGAVTVHFAHTGLGTTFGEHFVVPIEREVKS